MADDREFSKITVTLHLHIHETQVAIINVGDFFDI